MATRSHKSRNSTAPVSLGSEEDLPEPSEEEVASATSASQEDEEEDIEQEPPPTYYHLILFQKGSQAINRRLFRAIQHKLDEIITTTPDQTAIDIWIESPGGDAHAAYKLFLDLRARCVQLRAVVPDYAKSAATMLVLGMDTIYMTPAAELGPLDVQLEHPDKEGVMISGLDISDALVALGQTAVDLAIGGGAFMLDFIQLPRQQVLNEMLHFTAQFLSPAVSRIDPHLVHQAAQQLQVAENYAVQMLGRRHVPDDKAMSPEQAEALVHHLVNEYPTHGQVIDREEASELGLPIERAESYFRWGVVRYLYNQFADGDKSFVEVLADADMVGPVAPAQEGGKPDDQANGAKTKHAAHRPDRERHSTPFGP